MLAIESWVIRREGTTITVENVHYNHRGVMQLALGEAARMNAEGFRFNYESRAWEVEVNEILMYQDPAAGVTNEDVDAQFVQELLLLAIGAGAELTPDMITGAGGSRSEGGYGRR